MARLLCCVQAVSVFCVLATCVWADDPLPPEPADVLSVPVSLRASYSAAVGNPDNAAGPGATAPAANVPGGNPVCCSPPGGDPACCCNQASCDQSGCNCGCANGPGCGLWGNWLQGCDCQPHWSISLSAVIFNRSRPDPLQIIHPIGSSATVSSGSDFSFGPMTGIDASATRRMNSGNSWQVRFLGGFDWNASKNYGAVGNVQIGTYSNFGATHLRALDSTRLNSTEVNWLRPLGERLTFLAGFRALSLRDQLGYNIAFPAFNANYSWVESNHLYGGQVGGIADLWRLDGPLRVTATAKAGAFGNTAVNGFNLLPSTGGAFTGGATGTQSAFVGEITFGASYQITRHLAVRGGYELLWVDHVALAVDQAAAATAHGTQSAISMTGNTFFNGITAGADVTW